MTDTQRKRVVQALAETQEAMARAMRYSPDLRDHALIAFYEAHIAKLTGMLNA
jgi:hypothetical protein